MPRHTLTYSADEATILQLDSSQSACPGMLYVSNDTNRTWVGAIDGSLIGPLVVGDTITSRGEYPNDIAAGNDGVEVGEYYTLTPNNEYAMAPGLLKKRVL